MNFIASHFRCRSVMTEARVPSAVAGLSKRGAKQTYHHYCTRISVGASRKAKPLTRATYIPRYASLQDVMRVTETFISTLLQQAALAYDDSVAFAALLLLHRYRCKFPAGKRPSGYGHRLFLLAYVLAIKSMGDNAPNNSNIIRWLNRTTDPLPVEMSTKTLNRGERLFGDVLEWNTHITPTQLEVFTRRAKEDFAGEGPYPEYASPSRTFGSTPRTTAEVADLDYDSDDCTQSEVGDY